VWANEGGDVDNVFEEKGKAADERGRVPGVT